MRTGESELELWPSYGEYPVYDELLYYAMAKDELRNSMYRRVIEKRVKNKSVVDMGTGGEVVLARMCVEAGASKVYAIEVNEEAYKMSKNTIARLGLEKKIALIKGDAREIDLPEKMDICVSELIGTVGSAEGVISILNDSRKLLKDGGEIVPFRCVTKIAGVRFGDDLRLNNGLSEIASYYTEKIYESVGRRFDVRMCVKNVQEKHIMTEVADFEELEMIKVMEVDGRRYIRVKVIKDGKIDGFILWVRLEVEEGRWLDALDDVCSWLPVYYPVFYPGVEVSEMDVVEIECLRALSDNGLNPDYAVSGRIKRRFFDDVEYSYESRHHPEVYKEGKFYSELNEAVKRGISITT